MGQQFDEWLHEACVFIIFRLYFHTSHTNFETETAST